MIVTVIVSAASAYADEDLSWADSGKSQSEYFAGGQWSVATINGSVQTIYKKDGTIFGGANGEAVSGDTVRYIRSDYQYGEWYKVVVSGPTHSSDIAGFMMKAQIAFGKRPETVTAANTDSLKDISGTAAARDQDKVTSSAQEKTTSGKKSNDGIAPLNGGSDEIKVSDEWGSMISTIGGIFAALTGMGGAVGLAWCGIEFAYGNEEVANKAKNKAFIIVACVAGIVILSLVIKLGLEFVRSSNLVWDPTNLGGAMDVS